MGGRPGRNPDEYQAVDIFGSPKGPLVTTPDQFKQPITGRLINDANEGHRAGNKSHKDILP